VDDVSLPEGFTYDVVASYRDRIGGGEPFGYIDPARASDPVPGLVVVPFRATSSRARTSSARRSCTWPATR
jgi:hypothetical protein